MYTSRNAKTVWGRAKKSYLTEAQDEQKRVRPQKCGHVFYSESAMPGLKG